MFTFFVECTEINARIFRNHKKHFECKIFTVITNKINSNLMQKLEYD